jgi:hypothetical protein
MSRGRAQRLLSHTSDRADWWDSLDIEEALHPQTLLAWAMNGRDLPVAFGGPLRMRVPGQLGYRASVHHAPAGNGRVKASAAVDPKSELQVCASAGI